MFIKLFNRTQKPLNKFYATDIFGLIKSDKMTVRLIESSHPHNDIGLSRTPSYIALESGVLSIGRRSAVRIDREGAIIEFP